MPPTNPREPPTLGPRLSEQAPWLALLLRHLAGPRVREQADVEDLVQEVYLRVLQSRAAPPPPEPGEAALRRWLVRVARTTVLDVARALRARKRSARTLPLDRSSWSRSGVGPGDVPFAGPGPSTELLHREREVALADAFDRLAPDHRRVLGLRQFEGLSAAEAGRRLGRSESAVHSLYRRALQAWSEALPSAEEPP